MSSSSTLVLVPGSFAESHMYDGVVKPLREKGYDIFVLDPPCYPGAYKAGRVGPPPPGMQDDARFVAKQLQELVDAGKDIVVLGHSYGGIPATESLKGFTKKERQDQGNPGGVVRIAYMTACVPRVGENLVQVIQGGAPGMEIGEDGWMRHSDPSATAAMCFSDLPVEEGTKLASQFGRHSSVSFGDALTHNGYKDLPVSWLFCENDRCVTPQVQQTAIEAIEESWKGTDREGRKVDVKRLTCDHIPIYSSRDETEKWMESIIIKGGQE